MDVLIVSRGLPTLENPTFGIFEFDQAKALAEAGIHITFFAVDLRSIRRKRKFGISHEKKENIDCYTISIPVGAVPDTIFANIGMWALRFLYGYVYKNRRKPDLIHAHFTLQGYMASKLSKKKNIPLVITEHSSEMNRERISDSLLKFAKSAYMQAECVIAVGNGLACNIKKHTGVECIVIPNIVDLSLYKVNAKKDNKDIFLFISVGRLIPLKRTDLLIRAFAKFYGIHSDTELVIYGNGEEMNSLRKLADSLGMHDCINFCGAVSREHIAKKMRYADCFVLLSDKETFGVAYIEAIASGIPVIATKCGGPEDFMSEKYGLLIDTNDEEQAVNAMEYMYKNSSTYEVSTMRSDMEKLFSAKTIVSKIIAQYKKVCDQGVEE